MQHFYLDTSVSKNIVAHIAGISSSDKTTLGLKIQKQYPNIIVKDLDDFNDCIIKDKNFIDCTDKNKYYGSKFYKLLIDHLKNNMNKKIIFVGCNYHWNNWFDLSTSNTFFIKPYIPSIIQHFNQHINLDAPLINFDCNKWAQDIKDEYNLYSEKNYIVMPTELIYENIVNLLKF